MVILLICALLLHVPSTLACFGAGGACCMPSQTCAPSVPPCPAPSAGYAQPAPVPQACVAPPCPTGSSYGGSSYSGAYAAPPSSYAAPASNYAPVSSYAVPAGQYVAAQSVNFPSTLYGSGLAPAAPNPFTAGNSPVVRKVVTMQKSLPETKLTVEDGEKPETIEIVDQQPQQPEAPVGRSESETNSVAESVPAETVKKTNVEEESAKPDPQTPVPIVILPLSTATPDSSSQTTVTSESAAGGESPLSNEYQSSIDNAYEEIASEEEALKKQEIDFNKSDKEAETIAEPDSEHGHSGNEELTATSKEPERPATLIESYQGYYQEPTAEPIPQGQEQSMAGMESGQRVDAPSSSQSGEYVEDTSVPEEPNNEPDGGACNNEELRAIVENALRSETDNLEAARQIEGDASKKFGGRFNAIVSDAEFAYVNWYGKMNCQLRVGNRHSLTWED